MEKIRLTAVSYLNTKPLLYGLLQSELADRIDLVLDIPSRCADKLTRGEADIGLIPVATLPGLQGARLFSDYCIGSKGSVRTVCIFSRRPLKEIRQLYLDYHSRTSVELVKILLRDYWQLSPELLPAEPGYEQDIGGEKAGLIIGDRAIQWESHFPYAYDLGEAWKEWTDLPFVYAAWVSLRPLPANFEKDFNRALEKGIRQIPQLTFLLTPPSPDFDLQGYFTDHISYRFDRDKRRALDLFLSKMTVQPDHPRADLRNHQV